MQSYALIADPDVAAAAVYVAAAREEGLTYVCVRDGARAIGVLAERGTPDVLVTEVTLPSLDGFELVDRVRRAPSGDATAVIMVSGDRSLRELAAAKRAELDLGAVLSKAASLDSVRRVLKRLRSGRGVPDADDNEDTLPATFGVAAPPEAPKPLQWTRPKALFRSLIRRG